MSSTYPVSRRFYGKIIEPRETYRIEAVANMHYIFGNSSPYFAITADMRNSLGREEACGCLHDEICLAIPELRPYIKWHLTGLEGPMHYEANAVFYWQQWRHETKYLAQHYDPYEAFQRLTQWGLYGNETDEYLRYLFHSQDVTESQMRSILRHRRPILMHNFTLDMQSLFGKYEWQDAVTRADADWRREKDRREREITARNNRTRGMAT